MKILKCKCSELIEHYGRYMTCERCLFIEHHKDPDMKEFHEPHWHVVVSQGRIILGVYGSELLAMAEEKMKSIEAATGFPAWLEMVVGDRPEVGAPL